MPSRREFIQRSVVSAVGLSVPGSALAGGTRPPTARTSPPRPTFVDLLRLPDGVMIQSSDGMTALRASGNGRWEGVRGLAVATARESDALRVSLEAPSTDVLRLHLRWRADLDATRLCLGDAWERAYGDLEWRGMVPERVMPWYFAASDGALTHAYGVRTGASSFCFWQADSEGITLWADVRSGGVGVRLGRRTLTVCDVLCREGRPGESAFAAVHAFCRRMCAHSRAPARPVYGHNDWYAAYGNNSAESVRADAHRIVELSPSGSNRPFCVIDDGWQPERGSDKKGRGLWNRGNERFPDMAKLASDVHTAGARPGIWIRPLEAPDDAPLGWRLAREHGTLDPSVPEVLHKVSADMARLCGWGFELVKHDYSTFDVLGRWGFQMGATLTDKGWTFATGRTRTTAEVLNELYGAIRTACGDTFITGCNTVSHLSAGVFDMCRIGDDTSGREWARTRKMGVNALAFRGPQHGAFYGADPDCVGVTTHVPWTYNRQWLDLVARSGTILFVSIAADALGDAQRRDLRAALAMAARPQPLGEASDWQRSLWPQRWRLTSEEHTYDWIGPAGLTAIPG